MRTPEQLKVHAAKFLRNHFSEALAHPDSLSLDWPLHPPTAAAAASNPAETRAFIQSWQRWPHPDEVVTISRRWTSEGLGVNEVPVRVALRGADRIADAAGLNNQLSSATVTARRITSVFPDEPAFAAAVFRSHALWSNYSEYDLHCLAACLAWLRANPDSGLWERAVPIEGVDGKWIGSHRQVLLKLLAPFGITELGLLASDATLRLRFLNHTPSLHGIAHLSDVAVPFSAAAGLFTAPPRVLIVENKETFLALPQTNDENPPTVLIFGSGYAARHLQDIPWMHGASITYWGDLDVDGFRILSDVRAHLEVSSVLMDADTVRTHRHLAVPDPRSNPSPPHNLTSQELEAFNMLYTEGGLRIEQERIPYNDVLRCLSRIFGDTSSEAH